MRRSFNVLILTIVFLSGLSRLVVAASVTMTTYYPAPFGAYDRLRLVPRASLSGVCQVGSLYVRTSDNTLQYCALVSGVGTWGPLSGLWAMTAQPAGFDTYNPSTLVDQYYFTTNYPNLTLRKPYVGIGTNNPQRLLHLVVNDSGTPTTLAIENLSNSNNNGANISFRGVKEGLDFKEFISLVATYEDHADATARSKLSFHLRDGAGNLQEQLTLKGRGYAGFRDPDADGVVELSGNATLILPNTDTYFLVSAKADNDGDVMIVNASGNVGINDSTPSEKLEVNGNIKATGLYLSSDADLKRNIEPVDHALERISGLTGVTYEWKSDPVDVNKKHLGVIAQDVEKIFPDAVRGENGAKAVDYPALIAPLIEAVKELKAQNEYQDGLIRRQQEQIMVLQDALDKTQNEN